MLARVNYSEDGFDSRERKWPEKKRKACYRLREKLQDLPISHQPSPVSDVLTFPNWPGVSGPKVEMLGAGYLLCST